MYLFNIHLIYFQYLEMIINDGGQAELLTIFVLHKNR